MCAWSRSSKRGSTGSPRLLTPEKLLARYRQLAGELETLMYTLEIQLAGAGYLDTLERARAIRLAVSQEMGKWSELAESLLRSSRSSWLTRLADSRDSTTASPE